MTSSKPLTDRIADRVKKQGQSARRQGRNTFLALKPDIAEAMTAGWTIKDIWKTLKEEGRIVVSYQAFVGYTKRYITDVPHPVPTGLTKPNSRSGFSLNPTANKEELL